nr:MAG TPA: hypothetical protein [Caudoviricetes sp.]
MQEEYVVISLVMVVQQLFWLTVPLPEVSKELVVQEELWGKCSQSLQSPPAKIPER